MNKKNKNYALIFPMGFDRLEFSYNWNNKLFNKCFTTLRLSNRFVVGHRYDVYLLNDYLVSVEVLQIKFFKLDEINMYVSYLDSGYSPAECKNILQKMYKNKNVDWSKQLISFVLLKTIF